MKGMALVLIVAAAGCDDDEPLNVEGNYSINVTNRDNGCNFPNWTVGESSANIPVQITQEGANVTATITGLVGTFVSLRLGSNVYSGTIDGDAIDLDLFGSAQQSSGNCAFTYNSTILGDVNGDALDGRVEYRAATNGNPDCAAIEGCLSFQEFNGARPPT